MEEKIKRDNDEQEKTADRELDTPIDEDSKTNLRFDGMLYSFECYASKQKGK